jgi:hypothetical protein
MNAGFLLHIVDPSSYSGACETRGFGGRRLGVRSRPENKVLFATLVYTNRRDHRGNVICSFYTVSKARPHAQHTGCALSRR